MNHRTIYLTAMMSLITFFPPRLASQETKNTNPTKEAPVQRVKGPSQTGAGPAGQRSSRVPEKSSRAPNINETKTRLNEVEAAEEFLQLKDRVYADLIRLEDEKGAEPIQKSMRAAKSDFHFGVKTEVSSGKLIKESRAQITDEAPPAPSKSVAGSNNK